MIPRLRQKEEGERGGGKGVHITCGYISVIFLLVHLDHIKTVLRPHGMAWMGREGGGAEALLRAGKSAAISSVSAAEKWHDIISRSCVTARLMPCKKGKKSPPPINASIVCACTVCGAVRCTGHLKG